MNDFDCVVIGNGLVGASLLLSLESLNLNIAVIDKMPLSAGSTPAAPSGRAIALSYSSVKFYQKLNIWQTVQAFACPIQTVHVSLQNHFGITKLKAQDFDLPYLGMVVDAHVLNGCLHEKLKSQSRLSVFCPDQIIQCEYTNNAWVLKLAKGGTIHTKLLIGADGTDSFLRQRMGLSATIEHYEEVALVANVYLKQDHQNYAFERFLQERGSIALLPMSEKKMKSVWVVQNNRAEHLKKLSESDYLKNIQTEFGFRLGRFKSVEKPIFFPLKKMNAETLYGQGFVLIGNSANTLHPLGAQGLNLGLRDVVVLTESILQAQKQEKNIAETAVLADYSNSRQRDHFFTNVFTQGMLGKMRFKQGNLLAAILFPQYQKMIVKQGLGENVI